MVARPVERWVAPTNDKAFLMAVIGGLTGNRLVSGRARCALFSSIVLIAGFADWSRAQAEETFSAVAKDVQAIFEKNKEAIVKIESEDSHGLLMGTGFFVSPTGMIYTSYHVAGESTDIVAEFGDKRYPAHRLVADIRSGIAILKIDAVTPWIPLGDSDQIVTASAVMMIGFPLDQSVTPNYGIVGGLDQGRENRYFATTLIRANIAAQRGEEGAPLLDLDGHVVGIVVGSVDDRTACYALPIKAAEKARSDYVRFGEIRQGWVGVTAVDNEQIEHESKVVIRGIDDNSPAHIAGLQSGDILLSIGTAKIHSTSDLVNACFFLTVNQKVPITVFRAGQEVQVDVTPTQGQLGAVSGAAFAPGYLINSDSSLRLRIEN
jgi:S1-C subfamily serine protease